ncbi:uncharacterized protein GIQ15_06959 [Arthroderma uncinatum]|uniref:uncharacterized protein n=1 Tax=Arthroderma uncinatum TaxID=74035 RepID=UPI00144A91D4|nr:uncharacterized protein GIQ15_06959 [Arthroderma uncinatum]KAF3479983.1 hypothetical protein GIQ15_06959 [Arthroderma uncinatum]
MASTVSSGDQGTAIGEEKMVSGVPQTQSLAKDNTTLDTPLEPTKQMLQQVGSHSVGDQTDDTNRTSEQPLPGQKITPRPKPLSTMAVRPVSPLPLRSLSPNRASVSPHRARHAYMAPTSPNRQLSPHSQMHSPASSQIFERDVQEDFPIQTSPSIPSHIVTENHIPPILEASSAALTDDRLDPDSVEIVTHNLHQPASLSVVGSGAATSHGEHSLASSFYEYASAQSPCDPEENASTYGGFDSTDIRRLSFVSFADLVHAEQVESYDHASNRDSQIMGGLAALANAPTVNSNRSPSPMRSPISSHGPGSSPPTSVSPGEPRGFETSPNRGTRVPRSPPPCPHSPSGTFSSDLNVETMRQALRRTGSGDMGSFRNPPLSAAASDTAYERPFK